MIAGQSAAELQYLQQQLPAAAAPFLQYQSAATAAAAAGRLNAHFQPQTQSSSQRSTATSSQFQRQTAEAAFPTAQQLCVPSVVLAPGLMPGRNIDFVIVEEIFACSESNIYSF